MPGRRPEEKEETGFERTRMRRRRRRKSCGHGCTERDSGCTSTCPFSAGAPPGRDLWKQRAGGAGNTGRHSVPAVFHHERSSRDRERERETEKLTLSGYLISGSALVEFLTHLTSLHQITWPADGERKRSAARP